MQHSLTQQLRNLTLPVPPAPYLMLQSVSAKLPEAETSSPLALCRSMQRM